MSGGGVSGDASHPASLLAGAPRFGLSPVPLVRDEVNAYLAHHRHHGRVTGYRYGVGALRGGELVGVASVGRPEARRIPQYRIVEVNRVCTDGSPHVCSFLYGFAWLGFVIGVGPRMPGEPR